MAKKTKKAKKKAKTTYLKPPIPAKGPKKAKKKKAAKKSSKTCFVLMPFREPFESYYSTIILPAVAKANLKPMRGNSLFRPTPIMGDIWAMIQNANVLLAVLTTKNANVFYELGLGHAVGKPIVLVSETIDDVPFDLQPLRVILYDKDDSEWGGKLRMKITKALKETLTDPVEAVPPMFRKKVKSKAPEESELSLRLAAIERKVALFDSDKRLSKMIDPFKNIRDLYIQERFLDHGRVVNVANECLRMGWTKEAIEERLRGFLKSYTIKDIMKYV